jgi:hypothetical protein
MRSRSLFFRAASLTQPATATTRIAAVSTCHVARLRKREGTGAGIDSVCTARSIGDQRLRCNKMVGVAGGMEGRWLWRPEEVDPGVA